MRFIHYGGDNNTGRKRQGGYGSDRPLISQPVREYTGDKQSEYLSVIKDRKCMTRVFQSRRSQGDRDSQTPGDKMTAGRTTIEECCRGEEPSAFLQSQSLAARRKGQRCSAMPKPTSTSWAGGV